MTETAQNSSLDRLLTHIRPSIRGEKPYLVGGIHEPEIKLNQNESPFDLPEDLKRELIEAFMEIPFNRYPHEQPEQLRRALGEYAGHDPEGILIGNGSNELMYTLGLTLIDKGTPVVLPRPMFSLYEKIVRLHEGQLVAVPPRADLSFDAEAIAEAVRRHRPTVTVVTTPNNPTGLAMPLAEIEPIVQAAEGFVVVDEAYVEFTEEESAQTLLARYPNVILLRTMSKACGLAGMRLGYMMARPEVIGEIFKARLPFMIDRLAETTALALLRRPELLRDRVAQLKTSCRTLTESLRAIEQVEVIPSQANFVLFKTALEPGLLMNRLAEAGVLVRNMSGYPELQGYLRVNAGTPQENNAFVAALKEAL